jgi:transmembrane sensor
MENPNRQLEYLHAQQASAWVQILFDPTLDQRAAFVRWLKDSPRNVRDFLFMLTVEQALDHLDSGRLHSIESLLAQVDGRVIPLRTPLARAPSGSVLRPRRRYLLAAGLLAATFAAWQFLAHQPSGWKEFATATGEQRAFEIEDGSVIHLNTDSKVALRLSARSREVRLLRGEALFRVHHDSSRPFLVYTSDAVIQAIGTQFNVYDRPDGTEVAVIEGRVSVTPEPHPALAKFNEPATGTANGRATDPRHPETGTRSVGASEEAHVDRGGLLSVHAVPDVADVVAWRDRRLVFREDSLERIVEEFNRYSKRQIHLEGADVQARVFSGVFDADDPDSLAQVLARDSSLSIHYDDRIIIVTGR